jgi:hypothetical protein
MTYDITLKNLKGNPQQWISFLKQRGFDIKKEVSSKGDPYYSGDIENADETVHVEVSIERHNKKWEITLLQHWDEPSLKVQEDTAEAIAKKFGGRFKRMTAEEKETWQVPVIAALNTYLNKGYKPVQSKKMKS